MAKFTRNSFNRILHNECGNIAIMSALMTPMLVAVAAFGVDEGAIFYDKRILQGNTDVAAIVAADNIAAAEAFARTSLAENGLKTLGLSTAKSASNFSAPGGATVMVETGKYVPDTAVQPFDRFNTLQGHHNAVRVTVKKTSKLYFSSMFASPPEITTVAVARKQAQAAFAVGSRLASLKDGILNGILSGLLGSEISLSVMDYRSLAAARVDVLPFLDAIGKELDLNAVTYDSLLENSLSYAQLSKVLSKMPMLDTNARSAAQLLGRQSGNNSKKVNLSQLIELGEVGKLGVGQMHGSYGITASVIDILGASAVLGGNNQVSVDLGANIPGIAKSTISLAIGEKMQKSAWLAVGETGTMVHTAQTRLYAVFSLGGKGALAGLTVRLPIYLDLAYANAELEDVNCIGNGKTARSVKIGVQPGIAKFSLAEISPANMNDFGMEPVLKPASIISSSLLNVKGAASIVAGNTKVKSVVFADNEISRHVTKTVSTENLSASIVGSLLQKTTLTVTTAGLALSLPQISQATRDTLTDNAATLDQALFGIVSLLGIGVGEADVTVLGTNCSGSVLVQ